MSTGRIALQCRTYAYTHADIATVTNMEISCDKGSFASKHEMSENLTETTTHPRNLAQPEGVAPPLASLNNLLRRRTRMQICCCGYRCATVGCYGNCSAVVRAVTCRCHGDRYMSTVLHPEAWWVRRTVYTMVFRQRHLSNRTFISHVWESFMVKKSWLSGHSILLHVSLDSSKLKWWIKFDIKCSVICLVIYYIERWRCYTSRQ